MATTTFTVTHSRSSDYKGRETDSARVVAGKIATFFQALGGGVYQGSSIEVSQDPATGTVTLSGVDGTAATGSYALSNVGGTAATGNITFNTASGAWTATVNGVAFGGTVVGDQQAAEDLYLAINDSADPAIAGVVTASWNGSDGVVDIDADAKGTAGNAITLAVTGTGVSRSAATLTGGAQGAVTVVINGTSVGPVDTTNLTDTAAATAVSAAIEANGTLGPLLAAVGSTTNVALTWGTKGTVGNAVTLAAGVSATGTATRSGATLSGGAQNEVTVTVGGVAVVTDTTTLSNSAAATAVAAAIAADSGAADLVTASAASNVVTLTAVAAGEEGNGISLVAATDAGTATASGAYLAGGSSVTYTL
jgi:phage tail sheath gpL-like